MNRRFRATGLGLATLFLLAGVHLHGAEDAPKHAWKTAKSPAHGVPYAYYVPASYTGEERVPFVLSYHGKDGHAEGEIRQWVPLAEKHGFIVACPTSRLAGAKATKAKTPPPGVNPVSMEFQAGVSIAIRFKKEYNVDARHLMVTGFSGGGNPAFLIGFMAPQHFRYVCGRSANFSPIAFMAAQKNKKIAALVSTAIKKTYFYYYYGSKDHPIILNTEVPRIQNITTKFPFAHWETKKIEGMIHQSRAPLAATWFMETIETTREEWKQEITSNHAKALERLGTDEAKTNAALEWAFVVQGTRCEEYYPSLGTKMTKRKAELEDKAKSLLDEVSALLEKDKKTEARAKLETLLKTYRGSAVFEKGAQMYQSLKPKENTPVLEGFDGGI